MHDQARQDLTVIRQLMEQTRQEVTERGRHLIIWGVISTAGLLATYVAVTTRAAYDPAKVWFGLLALGWVASVWIGIVDGRRARVRTMGRRLLSAVWITAGVTLTVVGVAGMTASPVDVRALPGLLSVMMGAPVMLTALLTGERWLGAVAAAWWVAGTIMLFVPGLYTLLVMAALSLLLLAVPGGVLYVRSRHRAALHAHATDAG